MSLPAGFAVRVHHDVEAADDGRVLVGGSPLRVVRLSERAQELLEGRDLRVRDRASELLADRLIDANIALPVLRQCDQIPAEQLTVVIPVQDRADQLDRALTGVDGLSVIVVDDASQSPCAVAEVARAHGAEILHLDHNVGPAAARNAGLGRVHTPYVAFVDSDVQVTSDTLLALTAHFADPRVCLVAPHVKVRAVHHKPRWHERFDESSPGLGLGERACVVRPGAAVAWLPSACLVARTDRLLTAPIGGFDGRMRIGEDVDLVWRLVAAGERVRYDPAFEAYHDTRPTLRSWMGRKFAYGTGGAALAERHPDNVVTAILSPTMGVACLSVLLRRPWSIPVALLATAWGARAVARALPDTPERPRLAITLALRGLGWSLRQESALVLRHWWPIAAATSLVSSRGRRVIVSSIVIDVIATRIENPEKHPLLTLAGRRLDDLAYGAGLWWGALRWRSVRCLRIRTTGWPNACVSARDGESAREVA